MKGVGASLGTSARRLARRRTARGAPQRPPARCHASGRPGPGPGAHLGAKQLVVVTTAATAAGPSHATAASIPATSVASWSPSRRSSTTSGTWSNAGQKRRRAVNRDP